MENILIKSKPIEIAEHKNYKLATFLISVLDEYNENDVLITKEAGEQFHKTIIGFPIVAKLVTDMFGNPVDFKGHEISQIKNKDGSKEYKFNTMPIGSVLDSWIEDREVNGYDGIKSCIMVSAKLWNTRYPEYFKVLDDLWSENNVDTSWEIATEETESTLRGKILKAFSFIGNCLLGRTVEGAVTGAGMIEYAETDNVELNDEFNLAQALSLDCINKEGEKNLKNAKAEPIVATNVSVKENNIENVNTNTENVTNVSENVEGNVTISEITIEDLRKVIEKYVNERNGCGCVHHIFVDEKYFLTHSWTMSSLEYWKYTYAVIDGEIVIDGNPEKIKLVVDIANVNESIASKDEEIIKSNAEIENLKAQIVELSEYKTKYEAFMAEKEAIEKAEQIENLKKYAIDSGYISAEEIESSEEIKPMIENLDEAKIKAVIVDRLMESKKKCIAKAEKETKEETDKTVINLSSVEEIPPVYKDINSCKSVMKNYING